MNSIIVVSIIVFSFYEGTWSYLNGFPKEQCDAMDPTKIKIDESMIKGAESDYNNTDRGSEDSVLPTSLQLSGSLNLYRIVTPQHYKRGGILNITIRGPEFNAIMLQVRKIGTDERRGFDQVVRTGEFVSWPASLKPVHCDKEQQATAITNKNFSPKSGITIKWKAPKDDVGEIHVVARFVAGEEYWQITESKEIPLSDFPVNLKSCGKAKSCILYSEKSPSCHEDNCDYILTYSVNSTNVEFVLGGTAIGDHSYLAVGFSDTPEAVKMTLIACIRTKSSAEVKYYSFSSIEEGLVEQPMNLENKKMDLDGDRLWCSFVAPIVTTSDDGNGLDLSLPHYQVYMRGITNYTKSESIPILPSKLLVSKKEIQVEKIKLQYHTMEKPKQGSGTNTLTIFNSLFLLAILVYFQYIKSL